MSRNNYVFTVHSNDSQIIFFVAILKTVRTILIEVY